VDSRHWCAPVRCRLPGRTCLSVTAEEILTEDLPQLPLQIATVHIMLYAFTIFKFYAIIGQYEALYKPIKSTCYTYLMCQEGFGCDLLPGLKTEDSYFNDLLSQYLDRLWPSVRGCELQTDLQLPVLHLDLVLPDAQGLDLSFEPCYLP